MATHGAPARPPARPDPSLPGPVPRTEGQHRRTPGLDGDEARPRDLRPRRDLLEPSGERTDNHPLPRSPVPRRVRSRCPPRLTGTKARSPPVRSQMEGAPTVGSRRWCWLQLRGSRGGEWPFGPVTSPRDYATPSPAGTPFSTQSASASCTDLGQRGRGQQGQEGPGDELTHPEDYPRTGTHTHIEVCHTVRVPFQDSYVSTQSVWDGISEMIR